MLEILGMLNRNIQSQIHNAKFLSYLKQVMRHPFYAELYDPKNDKSIKDGTPVSYFDFRIEQYTINSKILRELLLDEIILSNR